jgi:hypothetical protein
MYDSGFQCVDETLDSSDFCESHQKIVAFPPLEDHPMRKAVMRFVALLLLLLFLIPLLFSLRNLYLGQPAKAQEVS